MKLKQLFILIPALLILTTMASMIGGNANNITIELSDKNGHKLCKVSYRDYTGDVYDQCGQDLRCVCGKIGM